MEATDQKNKTIMFLSQYFWPEEMATSELLSGIALELSKSGYSVQALAGQPAYWKGYGDIPRFLEREGVMVQRVKSTRLDKNTTLGRVLNSVSFSLAILLQSIFVKQPNLFIAVTNPPLLIWVARLAKILRGTSYVLIIHDVYPNIAIALNRLNETSLISRLWRMLNRWSYRGAEKIVALGECMADVLRKELSQTERSKVIVISNWADGAKIKPIPRENNILLKEWGLMDKFVVQYSGNIGLFHEIDSIVEAAKKLKNNKKIHFLFIGEGGQLPWLKNQISELGLLNISFKPFQAKEQIPLSLTACDLALVTLKYEATGFCVPSKLYGILASGKPVIGIANALTETARIIESGRCGFVVKPGDSKGLAKIIEYLSEEDEKCRQLGVAARDVFDKKYTLNNIASQYSDMLKDIVMD